MSHFNFILANQFWYSLPNYFDINFQYVFPKDQWQILLQDPYLPKHMFIMYLSTYFPISVQICSYLSTFVIQILLSKSAHCAGKKKRKRPRKQNKKPQKEKEQGQIKNARKGWETKGKILYEHQIPSQDRFKLKFTFHYSNYQSGTSLSVLFPMSLPLLILWCQWIFLHTSYLSFPLHRQDF